MKSSTKVPNGHGSLYKEVRFSPTATPIRRTQSVPHAHAAHRTQMLGTKADSATLSASYFQQVQALLDRQRMMIETERALFAQERGLWVHERHVLLARITELESLERDHGRTSSGRGSNVTSASHTGASAPKRSISFQLPFGAPHSTTSPDNRSTTTAQVWEGSSPGSRPTRVFTDTEKSDQQNLSIPEQGGHAGTLAVSPPSLDAALSPKSHAVDSTANASVSVPIERLDSKLDGITLKSSALPPEIVARVMTPPSPLSRETSPSSASHKAMERRNSLKLKLSDLGPPETNLVRDAGHTPMVCIDRDEETAQLSPKEGALDADEPLALAAPRQPAENSDSYFADLPDDPALKGPLSLLNEEDHDSEFLKELNQKLLDEARQAVGRSGGEELPEDETAASNQAEPEPEIKFKKTTNFGTAFGTELH
ncbi:hypothetical protein BDV59DRAFT_162291 [Aspergillus ambiguus]|uniref:uncharacterized protein n=1 Tax=Aspergillus ambiguus TaxID=176160 RepID=UPI003CCD2F43